MSGEDYSREMDRNTKFTSRDSMAPTKVGNGSDNQNPAKFNKKWRRRGGGSQSNPRPKAWDNNPSNSQRTYNQFTDKRPRSRGSYNDSHREEVTEDLRTEHGSVLKMGSKKTNLNHLLNFSVGHSDDTAYDSRWTSSVPYSGGRGKKTKKAAVRYNKEQFLQANCQFVVKESADYTVNAVDPDILVDWDLIEQVKIFGNEVPSCPICLYPPVVAKVTRCGHIYCWSCILHYLSLNDDEKKRTWRKCPICYDAIHQKDLKSVVTLENQSFRVGDEITLKLMKREKNTTFAMPVSQWQEDIKPYHVDDNVELCFSKLLLASPDQVQNILDSERTALEVQLADEGESLEGSYVKAALELLKERQINVNLAKAAKDSVEDQIKVVRQHESKGADASTGSSFTPLQKDVVEYSSAFSDEECGSEVVESPTLHTIQSAPELKTMARVASESSEDGQESVASSAPLSASEISLSEVKELQEDSSDAGIVAISTSDGQKVEVSVDEVTDDLVIPSEEAKVDENLAGATGGVSTDSTKLKSNAFYFYQSVDGQHIYLHSLNARCLVREYGSLENSPLEITAKIVELNGITMNQELRSRLRYLSHLPLTCEFKVAELALKPPILSKKTLAEFHDDIERKKRQRQRKQRVETKILKQRHQAEIRKYEGTPEMKLLLGNSPKFPEFSTKIVRSEMPSLLAQSPAGSASPDIVTPIGSPSSSQEVKVGSLGSDDGGQSSMSFAQMLRAGKMKSQSAWPALKEGPESSTRSERSERRSDSESEDHVPVPLYRDSFGDAISAALQTYTSTKSGNPPEAMAGSTEGTETTGKGKKKKKQKKLLFVNTMARAK